jgi:hypothetical protein
VLLNVRVCSLRPCCMQVEDAEKEGEDRIKKDKKDIEDYDALREKLLKEELDLLALKLNATVRLFLYVMYIYICLCMYVCMYNFRRSSTCSP